MGRVFLSEDPILKRQVAVKVISTDRHLDPRVLSEYLERFTVEAQACAKLNHPSIVSIYDAGEEGGVPWIAFEYVDGERLDALIAKKKQLPFDQILRIAGDIAAAMRHAHSLHIVHRDIKPANILIDGTSQIAKLADFGVVKAPFTAITQSGTAVGSPGYMSPEQIDNLEVDARSDIFSFGIVLYQMITGAHPFLRDTVQATFFATVSCNFTPIAKLREDVPEKLVKIVEKSLVADRDLRIINADELCLMIAVSMDYGTRAAGLLLAGGPDRGLAVRARHAYALALRGAKSIQKKLPPILQTNSASFAAWSMESVVHPAKNLFKKAYGSIERRFTKSQIAIALTGITTLIAAIVLVMLFVTISARSGDKNNIVKAAQEIGYDVKNSKDFADTCRVYINKCDYWNAGRIADILVTSKTKTIALQGHLFKAMSALCADRFNDAAGLFTAVGEFDGGEAAIRKEHEFFIRYLEKWIERELPDALVFLCAQKIYMNENHQVKVWTKDRHYWIRWNAVNILQTAGETVDLVPVYILDLEHAASTRTRVRAAEKLGDLGDRRAVAPLIAVRDNRNNPASSAARKVLREKFKVW
jgi:serine/threonine protein kinase